MTTSVCAQQLVFELLPSTNTGITFSNSVVENLASKENLFDYDYFYNGSGVGVLDINNDGLQDVYFAANQVQNKLYLNQGNFRFEDITSAAFDTTGSRWSTGVSIVDINRDGWQDIYVCQGGPFASEYRKNQLFINDGKNGFVEDAESYGLDDSGISTQAVFFDFDKDGDLDCFVVNESEAYGLDPVTFTRINLEKKRDLYGSYSHMYINEGGVYSDATKELGLDVATFGLGVKVSDINSDGWPDIYVSNDYYVPDMLFVNMRGAGFVDQTKSYLNHMSFYGMGLDIADINNDGRNDIFVLDMASGDHYRAKTLMRSMNVSNFRLLVEGLDLPYQYMYNSLQLSNGDQTYSNVSQMSGVSSTDWSWSALIEDFDFDGHKDIHVTNGYRRYALDNDFQAKIREAKSMHPSGVPLEIKKQLYMEMPSEKLANIFYHNNGDLTFSEAQFGSRDNPPSYSHGAAVADFDNDGDPDMVVNNLDDEAFIFRNLAVESGENNFITIKTANENGENINRVSFDMEGQRMIFDPSTVKGYLSSSEPAAFIGIGKSEKIDSLKVEWSDGTVNWLLDPQINMIHEIRKTADVTESVGTPEGISMFFDEIVPESIGLNYNHRENTYDDFEKEVLLPYKQSTAGPHISTTDLNGDSLSDLVISNSVGSAIASYVQTETGFDTIGISGLDRMVNIETGEISMIDGQDGRSVAMLLPASGNEDSDLSTFYQSRIIDLGVGEERVLPLTSGSTKKIVAIDYNNDGNVDLIECKRHVPQQYPKHAPSHIYEYGVDGFADVTELVFPDLFSYGMINDMVVVDFDKDGWDDVVVVGEWSDIKFYRNDKGKFLDVTESLNLPSLKGMWFCIKDIDLNQDGMVDFVVGNLGSNSKYKATKKKPLKIYGHDFDTNGTWDLVLSKQYKNDYVPLRGLECSSQQMPFINEKFDTYDLFAKATIDDVYGSQLDSAYYRYVDELNSVVLISNDGSYDVIKLPVKAQIAPILDMEVLDIDNDGREDVIIAGNIYETEVETPRLDGGQGLVLLSQGDGSFDVVAESISGLNLSGNIKSIVTLRHEGGNCNLLIATENGGQLRTFIFND